MVARWAFAEHSPFATIDKNGSRWDVASDYWLIVLYKRLVGGTRVRCSLLELALEGDIGRHTMLVA